MRRLAGLFWELFKISLFVIGGGYAIIAVADDVFSRKGWIREGELVEKLPVMQMIPGLIATHSAVYVGSRIAGASGAAVGAAAVAIPSVVIFTFVAMGYELLPLDSPYLKSAFAGLRAALAGVIAATVVRGWRRSVNDFFSYAVFLAAAWALASGAAGTVAVMAAAVALGLVKVHAERADGSASGRKTFRSSALAFLLFLKFGLLGFGGGFVLIPMYLESFVGESAPYLQLAESEFHNLVALSQMTPGPIGVNAVTFFGYRLSGVAGAAAASALLLLPGSVIAFFAFRSLERFSASTVVRGVMRGVQPAALALMAIALWAFAGESVLSLDPVSITITLASAAIIMKKKINIVVVILVSALTASVLRAETEDFAARFPDADAVVLEDVERVSYNPDGTSDMTAESWTKILTEKGRREQSRLALSYSKRYGSVEILYVGAVDAAGREREIDVSATTKESTDNSSMSANIYDPLDREIVCTVPGLKVGETLHVKIRRKTEKSRIKDHWADIAVMEWKTPILKSVYEVKAPAERPIRAKAVRNALGNVTETTRRLADGSTLHVFTATNSPQMFPEPDMPPVYTQVQNIRLSTAADWREISKWYWELCLPHLEKTSAEITNKVAELKGDLAGEALIRSIFKFVSQEIRYMGLTMEDTSPGYAPHDVDITFKNRYGVCRDKAGLLTAMLRLAGVKAYPVLINVGAKMDPDVPQPYFNHAIVAVEREAPGAGGRYMLMDPTNENTKDIFPAYLSDKSLLVCRPEGEDLMTSPVPPSAGNAVNIATKGRLSRDGALVLESKVEFLGINDTAYRGGLARRTPEERVKLFERIVGSVAAGAELLGCDISPADMADTETPVSARIVWKTPEATLAGRTRVELDVPFVSKAFGCVNWLLEGSTSLEKRRYPLVVDSTAEVRETVVLALAGGLGKVLSLPEKLEISGGYSYSREFSADGETLRAGRRLAVSAMEFSPEEYLKVRDDIKRVEAAERRRVQFGTDDLADADIEYILDRSETSILSPEGAPATEWVTTNEVVKRVLTYAGKKSAAELKFSYNPVWKKITVLEATVSNANGKVHSALGREMNVMDAGWTASAPRYDAEKILVVNLPSVEIGSVITVRTVTEVNGAPAPFYARFGFDSKEPLRRRAVRVDGWRREVVNPARVPDEPHQPAARLWRDVVTVSRCDWEDASRRLSVAAEVPEFAGDATFAGGGVKEIRDWMARYVKLAGPSLYDLPLERQLTDPAVVVKERYAARLDYVRTLASLLRKAGYGADIVFASANSAREPEILELDRETHPNIRAYSRPLCRVTEKKGGFLGFGAESATYFIGTENEYTPLGASALEGCDYFDPVRKEFGTVEVDGRFRPFERVRREYHVRENGAVDIEVSIEYYGATGDFRKRFAEILPEEKSRYYQTLLGNISQAASATSELETDVEGYPAKLSFKCFVPDFATVDQGVLTLPLPAFSCPLPELAGSTRETPFAVGAGKDAEEAVTVHFPEGYTEVEHLPREISGGRFSRRVSSGADGGRLAVTVSAATVKGECAVMAPERFAEMKDARRRAVSRSGRTVKVRRGKAGGAPQPAGGR